MISSRPYAKKKSKRKSKQHTMAISLTSWGFLKITKPVTEKKLFSFLKNSRRDQEGIPPLKENDTLFTETHAKANLCNRQFQSVFTCKSPLSLSRFPHMKVQDLVDDGSLPLGSVPDTNFSSVPVMPDLDISLNGILKLLKNLKPGKAAGPDQLKPLLLKELRDEIAPIIKIIFEKSLQTGKLPSDWVTANVMPVFKKRRQILCG